MKKKMTALSVFAALLGTTILSPISIYAQSADIDGLCQVIVGTFFRFRVSWED